jgi:hypothetical protein
MEFPIAEIGLNSQTSPNSPGLQDSGDGSPLPPKKAPRSSAEEESSRGLTYSILVHGAFILFVVIKSLIFPSQDTPILPVLRVDIVGLPDQLKNQITPPQTSASF